MRFYATFPQRLPLSQNYQIIEADNKDRAHAVMSEAYGSAWAFIYTEADFKDQPAKYGLFPIACILRDEG